VDKSMDGQQFPAGPYQKKYGHNVMIILLLSTGETAGVRERTAADINLAPPAIPGSGVASPFKGSRNQGKRDRRGLLMGGTGGDGQGQDSAQRLWHNQYHAHAKSSS